MKKLLTILSSIGLTGAAISTVVACGSTNNTNTDNKTILVDDNVTNGEYDSDNKTFTAAYSSNSYADNKMSFTIKELVLTPDNIVVKNSAGQGVAQNSGWSFTTGDSDTVITVDDYNLNGATITIKNVKGYQSITFNIVIPQGQTLQIDNVINGSYDINNKVFKSTYGSSKYSDHPLSFTVVGLVLTTNNIVVKNSAGQDVAQNSGWSFTTGDSDTVITVDDYNLNQATITIENLDEYWPTDFKIDINQDQDLVVGSVTNGNYDNSSKTLTAAYGSSKYNANKMSFMLTAVSLTTNNIVVTTSEGTVTTNGWSFVTTNRNTSITIDDYNLNDATISIQDVDGYWPVTLRVVINQDQVIVIGNVVNGSYDTSTNTLTATNGSSKYAANKMSFLLNNIVLTTSNIVVKDSTGTVNTSGWSFTTSGGSTTITIDDYNLNQATISIQDVDGYWPVTLRVVINQDQDLVVGSVINGSYDASSQTFTTSATDADYSSEPLSFVLTGVSLTSANVVVTTSGGATTTSGWSLSVANSNTTIQITDATLNQATVQIKDVDGYWPITFNITIPQAQTININSIVNGSYDQANKTLTAAYGSSQYNDHAMSFNIDGFALTTNNIVVTTSGGATTTSGWSFTTSGGSTTITINDYNLTNSTIQIKGIRGFYPLVINVVINQDQNITITNTVNGTYDQSLNILTAAYGSSQYETNKLSFTVTDLVLTTNNIVVTTSGGTTTTSGWSFVTNGGSTTITIDDYNLNQATISIQNVTGYWPITLNVVINQDQDLVVGSVANGSYDASSQTFTTSATDADYSSEPLSFVLTGVSLTSANVVVTTSGGTTTTSGWSLSVANSNTTIQITDATLNQATVQIKDVDGYWPVTFNITIPPGKTIAIDSVANGSYDASSTTFTATNSSSKYAGNELSFTLGGVSLTSANVVVTTSGGTTTTSGWSLSVANSNTTIQIDDYNLNNTTIQITGVRDYYPATYKIVISQDQQVTLNPGVVNGSYDESSKTFTHESDSYIVFSFGGIHLNIENIVVTDNNGNVIQTDQDPQLWKFWYAGDDENNTVFQFNTDASWSSATLQINLDGYWPATFKIIIS